MRRNKLIILFISFCSLSLVTVFFITKSTPDDSKAVSRNIDTSDPIKEPKPLVIWVNNGEDKVTQDELRLSYGKAFNNSVWDGEKVRIFGARNEVVAFNLILEAPLEELNDVGVIFNRLDGPDGNSITTRNLPDRQAGVGRIDKGRIGDDVFNFVGRNIELFYVRYLQIKGVGRLLYMPDYDERHVPEKLRLPYTLPKGTSKGKFEDRPNANKFYPDIAVPLEAVGLFDIAAKTNQSIWVDVYIPKNASAGVYKGNVTVSYELTSRRGDEGTGERGEEATRRRSDEVTKKETKTIPVELEVLPFELPDVPSAKTMVYYSDEHINDRYLGKKWPVRKELDFATAKFMDTVWINHHKLAHRHKISLIDGGIGLNMDYLQQFPDQKTFLWVDVLKGTAFTTDKGYEGPGVNTSSGIYSIGTYGAFNVKGSWNPEDEPSVWKECDRVVRWFKKVLPDVEYFIYLYDEPKSEKFTTIQRWAQWIKENPGPGNRLRTLVTSNLPKVKKYMPSVDIGFSDWGDTAVWKPIVEAYLKEEIEYWAYNGWRPSTGSFATEDDGIALRVIGWTQFKHKIGRWFYWQSTCYRNPSHVKLETNVFRTAWTFGRKGDKPHPKYGETGHNYSNGDGVLFYPGTETRFPEDNYGLPGPIASLRLKLWRRGIQDVDYLTMAHKIAPQAVDALVQKMIPKVLWEVGVTNPKDPTYVHTDISWSTDPDVWEAARRELANIIMSAQGSKLKAHEH